MRGSAPNIAPVDWPDDAVILYDGACVLCSGWVRFVAKRDTAGRFRFAPIQMPYGRALARHLDIDPDEPDTNALILGGKAYRRSDAAIAVLAALPGWTWIRALRLAPEAIRDPLYRAIARNRYRLFGRNTVCDLGGPDLRGRVIEG